MKRDELEFDSEVDLHPDVLNTESGRKKLEEKLNGVVDLTMPQEQKKPIFGWVATAIAVVALGLSIFASVKGGPIGPQGPIGKTGPNGNSPAATEVAEVLKTDNVFRAKIKGDSGPMGPAGKSVDSTELVALKARIAELERTKIEQKTALARAPRANPANQGIIDSSDNWEGHGDQDLPDGAKQLKAAITSWQTHDGWKFPLVKNRHGYPAPVKGGGPPMFLKQGSKVSEWEIRSITIPNPRGPGSYSTSGWAYKG